MRTNTTGGPHDRPRHNHFTRDIKSPGKCPACDLYWESERKILATTDF